MKRHLERREGRAGGQDRVIRPGRWAVVVLCLMPIAGAEDLPASDEQLRAAYCIPVVQTQVRAQSSLIAAIDKGRKEKDKQADEMSAGAHKQLAQVESVLSRLQESVRPLVPFADGSPLAAAYERGARDTDEYQAMLSRCAMKCFSAGASIDRCEDACQDKDLIARVQMCFKANWLPHEPTS